MTLSLSTGSIWPFVPHLHSGLLHLSGITYGGCDHPGLFPVSSTCCHWENSFLSPYCISHQISHRMFCVVKQRDKACKMCLYNVLPLLFHERLTFKRIRGGCLLRLLPWSQRVIVNRASSCWHLLYILCYFHTYSSQTPEKAVVSAYCYYIYLVVCLHEDMGGR